MAQIRIKVWGDYACFTRPEFKTERVSYPLITPSAARGLLEAIFWKPEFRYQIRRIGVLRLGTQVVILRNELTRRQGREPLFVEDHRAQRFTLLLKGVAYLLEADLVLRPHAQDPLAKYLDQLLRRVERGQFHHPPYLGTREFPAHFAPAAGEEPPPLDLPIGTMLFDVAFVPDNGRRELSFRHPTRGRVQGYAHPLFFQAEVRGGWLEVPAAKYQELYRLEEGHV